jgi:hypothetical protein
MSPAQLLEHGRRLPFDAPDAWLESDAGAPPPARDQYHAAARGVIADLRGRRGIKHGFDDPDEAIRCDIVNSLAAIIKSAVTST